jgi:hypothetical protein
MDVLAMRQRIGLLLGRAALTAKLGQRRNFVVQRAVAAGRGQGERKSRRISLMWGGG